MRIRAENRDLAFAVGNIGELLYLFEEHLQYSNELNTGVIREAEVRGFYEALVRYLLGMGAVEDALSIQSAFLGFLVATGQNDLAEFYRAPVAELNEVGDEYQPENGSKNLGFMSVRNYSPGFPSRRLL